MGVKNLHYGWVIIIASAGILITYGIIMYSFGVFLKPMTDSLHLGRGTISGALSFTIIFSGAAGVVCGRLVDKYNPRLIITVGAILSGLSYILTSLVTSLWQLYLIWGILMGTGSAFCFIPIMAIIPRWFSKRRGMAMGIAMAGSSVGGIIAPLLTQTLISASDWRRTYLILGIIITALATPLAQFIKASPQQAGLKPYGGEATAEAKQLQAPQAEMSVGQALRTSIFWLFGLVQLGFFFCMVTVMVHIDAHATDMLIPVVVAASILSFISGISAVGRLSIGFVADRIGGRLTLTVCLSLMTLAIVWLLFTNKVWMFYLFAVVFGLGNGGFLTLVPLVTVELFGLTSLGVIVGALTFVGMIGETIGAPLSGQIFQLTNSYSLAFIIAASICAMAVILSLTLLRYKSKPVMAQLEPDKAP
jgi:MFS family permease